MGEESLPPKLKVIITPLESAKWAQLLSGYPDIEFMNYVLRGLKHGFRIGFSHQSRELGSCQKNFSSAQERPEVVKDYIEEELARGRILEVSDKETQDLLVHCRPFGVIPKKSNPNKWRLILDLSSPEGKSVNDGIPKELSSLSYVSVDDVVHQIMKLGRGAYLAKMDVKQAYRNVPVHPTDSLLLGMRWEDKVYVDRTLPFGLRLAPLIFSALANALQWMMEQRGASWVRHYVDDFVTVGPPASLACGHNMEIMQETCERAGMPIEPDKNEGPAQVITFLGLELDTNHLEIRLPGEKLTRLRALLSA